MNTVILKKNIIKIPKNISVFFCENNILVIKGFLFTKSINGIICLVGVSIVVIDIF